MSLQYYSSDYLKITSTSSDLLSYYLFLGNLWSLPIQYLKKKEKKEGSGYFIYKYLISNNYMLLKIDNG